MFIATYQNRATPNRVDKVSYLSPVGEGLNGTLRDTTSITDMVISIEYYKVPDFNYVYIEDFNRYYFVVDVVAVTNEIWEITLKVDVLMSYRFGIWNSRGFVERSESSYKNFLVDTKIVIEEGYDIETYEIENDVFSTPYPEEDAEGDLEDSSALETFYVLNGYKIESGHDVLNT